MYWIYQTHIFSRENLYVQAKLVNPASGLLRKVYNMGELFSSKQSAPYNIDLDLTYQVESEYHPDNYFEDFGFQLYSKQLVELFQSFDVHAEYFPVIVVDQQGNILENLNYFIFHSLEGVLPAMDETLSEWKGSRDIGIPKLVLDYSKFHNRPLFLCDSIYVPLMRDDLKQAIQKLRLTGFSFIKPEKYRSGSYGVFLDSEE